MAFNPFDIIAIDIAHYFMLSLTVLLHYELNIDQV
jgi:hypothetical protein